MRSILLNRIISDARRYWPMHIVEGGESVGFRIGGMPPINVSPKRISERTHYFGTFPISGSRDVELSIFSSFDYVSFASPVFIGRHIHKLIDWDSEAIQCVFHEPAPRGDDPRLASELTGYGINVAPEFLDDIEDERSGVPHKIGGIPFLYPKLRGISDGLLTAGYCHLLQWAFPGKGDCLVKGPWPFADYMFHLYLRASKSGYDYKAILV
jgi:hypothetical protein